MKHPHQIKTGHTVLLNFYESFPVTSLDKLIVTLYLSILSLVKQNPSR